MVGSSPVTILFQSFKIRQNSVKSKFFFYRDLTHCLDDVVSYLGKAKYFHIHLAFLHSHTVCWIDSWSMPHRWHIRSFNIFHFQRLVRIGIHQHVTKTPSEHLYLQRDTDILETLPPFSAISEFFEDPREVFDQPRQRRSKQWILQH